MKTCRTCKHHVDVKPKFKNPMTFWIEPCCKNPKSEKYDTHTSPCDECEEYEARTN